ncbi:hypothetical protein LINGRAHAP2_LOCUS36520 [Linum grandiflorum]
MNTRIQCRAPLQQLLTWIHLLDIPLYFLNKVELERIVKFVGKSPRVYVTTASRERT